MNISRLLTMTGTLSFRTPDGAPDEYGDPTTNTTVSTVALWMHQEQRSDSGGDGGNGPRSVERWTCYLEPGTLIGHLDKLTVDGRTYQVFGEPWSATHPRTGTVELVVVSLRRLT